MTDRPILFSGPMVRALLAGTKTQTRRVLTQADGNDATGEHLHEVAALEKLHPSLDWSKHKRQRPSIHMPRRASRLTLTVSEVRIQRLQDISEADAIAEGCPVSTVPGTIGHPLCQVGFNEMGTPIFWFRKLWNNLNAERGFGWDANPWVVAVTSTVERRNIDEAPTATATTNGQAGDAEKPSCASQPRPGRQEGLL